MTRSLSLAAALALALAAPAAAQSPEGGPRLSAPGGQQQPSEPAAAEMPGPTTEIIGPDGSFRLQPDGTTWERFQSVRAIGVRCTDKACGSERVFCLIQVRGAQDAKAGQPVSQAAAEEFGAGVIRNSPKEMAADYVTPFSEKTFGPHPGRWADLKAEGEPGSLRFGLFLTNAEKHLVAFNCVSPTAKWDENKPKFESLIATLRTL
ncbi:hypothetical protein ACFOWB_11485 [Chenggangzhangella methanolivorans]|uniref:hypothetical protein n=1 Tax=Chenggangzhangella methanolivorans TaxID=1437009 RepID=UPI00361FE44C